MKKPIKTTLIRIDKDFNNELNRIFPDIPKSKLLKAMYDSSLVKDEAFLRKFKLNKRK